MGCVIKGQTPHFDLICSSTFNTILNLLITFNKPIGNGIITVNGNKLYRCKNTMKQPNKGSEAVNELFANGPKNLKIH